MKKPLKILLPFDFSDHSRETLAFVLAWGDCGQPQILLLHVVASSELEAFATLGGGPSEALANRQQEALGQLQTVADEARQGSPGLHISALVTTGVPFREICRIAEEEHASLIAIGTHGRTGFAHLLIGSTAERVVQHASCPVLSIKPRFV